MKREAVQSRTTSILRDIFLFQNLQLAIASCLVFKMGPKSSHCKDFNRLRPFLRSAYDEWVLNIKCSTYGYKIIRYWPCLVKATLIGQHVISVKCILKQDNYIH